jgi:hypothetical protein
LLYALWFHGGCLGGGMICQSWGLDMWCRSLLKYSVGTRTSSVWPPEKAVLQSLTVMHVYYC